MNLLYKFYPQAADGASTSFESAKLASDDEAIARAAEVLARHPDATAVLVWEKGRLVQLLRGESAAPPADEPAARRKPVRKPAKATRRAAGKRPLAQV